MTGIVEQIREVIETMSDKQPDKVQSYLVLSEILKILFTEGVVKHSSYEQLCIKADYFLMREQITGLDSMHTIELIANKYSKDTKTIQNIIYPLSDKPRKDR